jgi:hypothetical protein
MDDLHVKAAIEDVQLHERAAREPFQLAIYHLNDVEAQTLGARREHKNHLSASRKLKNK